MLSNCALRSYIGFTSNLKRRVRQHSLKLAAGAAYTRGFEQCRLEAFIGDIESKSEALSLEYHAKRRRPQTLTGASHARLGSFLGALQHEKFRQKPYTIYVRQAELVEPIRRLVPACMRVQALPVHL